MFLKNAWYVAAWVSEIESSLQQILVLDEKVCIYRDDSNQVVALEDACPHRKLPLSMGRMKDGGVECGYHGLTFNGQGQCTWAPGGSIPSKAKVHAYPVHEKYDLVWIWMGDPELANPDEIIDIPNFDNPQWGVNQGAAMDLHCNYLLMCDNLLDPTHVSWVHQSSFAQTATKHAPLKVTQTDTGYIVHRWMMDAEPAPFYKKVIEFEGNCDRLQHYEVRYPSHALIRAIFTPAGTGGAEGTLHENTFVMDSYNFMTPTTEIETRYYWFQLRNIRPEDEALSQLMTDDVQHAFEEDRVVLNAVQVGQDEKKTPNIDLPIDSGQLHYRRELAKMIERETALEKQGGGKKSVESKSVDEHVITLIPTGNIAASKAPAALSNLDFITQPEAWAKIEDQLATSEKPRPSSGQTVVFAGTGITTQWGESDKSLLELAEQNGLTPEHSCRRGICNTCKHKLLEGEVEYFRKVLRQPADNEVLLCCARPVGRVVIDL
jgi:vanillate O-demethylase monooxygenase subunit